MSIQNPANLISNLAASKALKADDGAYQTITKLIGMIGSNQTDVTNLIQNNTAGIDAITIIINALKNASILTSTDERAIIPASLKLTAGTNITFNLATLGELIISASGGGGSGIDYVLLGDGGSPTPTPINDGFGSFIYIPYEP